MSEPFGKPRFGHAPWSVKMTTEDVERCLAEARRRGYKKNLLESEVVITDETKALIEKAAGRKLKF